MFRNYDKMVYLQWFILLEQKRMEKKRINERKYH